MTKRRPEEDGGKGCHRQREQLLQRQPAGERSPHGYRKTPPLVWLEGPGQIPGGAAAGAERARVSETVLTEL